MDSFYSRFFPVTVFDVNEVNPHFQYRQHIVFNLFFKLYDSKTAVGIENSRKLSSSLGNSLPVTKIKVAVKHLFSSLLL